MTTTTTPTPTKQRPFGSLLIGAVVGFVVALAAALAASILAPSLAIIVFIAAWAISGPIAARRMVLHGTTPYWGEDFGVVRSVRRWD